GTGDPGDPHQLIQRDVEADVLQVVHAGAAHLDRGGRGHAGCAHAVTLLGWVPGGATARSATLEGDLRTGVRDGAVAVAGGGVLRRRQHAGRSVLQGAVE